MYIKIKSRDSGSTLSTIYVKLSTIYCFEYN